eukprot:s622_g1.t1
MLRNDTKIHCVLLFSKVSGALMNATSWATGLPRGRLGPVLAARGAIIPLVVVSSCSRKPEQQDQNLTAKRCTFPTSTWQERLSTAVALPLRQLHLSEPPFFSARRCVIGSSFCLPTRWPLAESACAASSLRPVGGCRVEEKDRPSSPDVMQEEGGGSFWATFGGGSNGTEASALEKLLQTPKCSVEALLDEEEVIQEFKTGNPKLVARLSEPDAIKVLMECITLDPPPEAGNARCFRYPFVAVELMTCAPPKFLELLVSKESDAMDLLWSFLKRTPAEVNPVLAGYFSRTATALTSKYKTEVLDYLRSRGPEQLLREFLDRIHLRSLAELLARLLSGESEAEVVFQTNDLVARFLSRWQEDSNSDAQENITLVLGELCSQKESLYWIEDLTQQLTEPSTVQFLIDHIFTQPSGVPPAMSLLTTVIIHTAGKEGAEVCASTPSLSPLAQPRLAEDMPPVSLDEPVVGEAAPAKMVSPGPPQTLKSSTSEWMERRRASLMREVAGHFPSFRQLLDTSLQEGETNRSLAMPQGSIKAVGGTTLEVISLITTLSRSGLEVILEAMLKHQLLPRCLQVFFQHPWSSLLHNCVKQLVVEVLSGSDPLRQQLSKQLLKEACLAERIVEEYAAEASWKATKQKHARVGYMGHLFLMSTALQECKSQEVADILTSTSGWREVAA